MKAGFVISALGVWIWSFSIAADDRVDFDKASLGWRTALHFDPAAEAPLSSLLQLHQRNGRVNDLLHLYAQHVAQYPADEGAKVVLARLYLQTGDARASVHLDAVVAQHPANAMLAKVRAQFWQASRDPRALEELDRAVALETTGSRRWRWLAELVTAAAAVQREDLVAARFRSLTQDGALTPEQRLPWARRLLEGGLIAAASAALEGADFSSLKGDPAIEALFLLSQVSLASGNRADAARHAATILDKLAPDHWRHREALALRWRAAADESERRRMLDEMAQRQRTALQSEAAAVGHGDLLMTAERREDALKIWREALNRFSESRVLEERILELLEQLRQTDTALEFLEERVARQPARDDLALRRARMLLSAGRVDAGMKALTELAAKAGAVNAADLLVRTARWLRARNLFGEACIVLEALLERESQRWEVRKELAELYLLLKRPRQNTAALFEGEIPRAMAQEVRLEVAQFLIAQKFWEPARRLLSGWVEAEPAEFEGRLLLSKVARLSGELSLSGRLLDECRSLADTEARYSAWLAAAWSRALEAEQTAEFIVAERTRLWPKAGETWDKERLARLSLLAQQSMQPETRNDAERLLRQALAADLPSERRGDLRLQLIQTLEGQPGREKDLETEIRAALAEPGAGKGDLQLRLALMYQRARRPDLAKAAIAEATAETCQDADLVNRGAKLADESELTAQAAALYRRLVALQPDERGHWVALTTFLVDRNDEGGLRLALREIQARSREWKLTETVRSELRRHLAASYWRTVATHLARDDTDALALGPALSALDELERLETDRDRKIWASWARGMLARRAGDENAAHHAAEVLKRSGQKWVDFPDGLSLALADAVAMIAAGGSAAGAHVSAAVPAAAHVQPPLAVGWSFAAADEADLQRWDLTPNGEAVVVMDAHNRLYFLDRRTGKLIWQRRMPKGGRGKPSGQEIDWTQGGESIQYPAEWVLGAHCLCVISDGGLYGLSVSDGAVVWQGVAAAGEGDCLAYDSGRILWWHPAAGTVEAYAEASGKLLWVQQVAPPWQPRNSSSGNPQWLTAGLDADAGKVLAWADGGVVLDVVDGRIIWRARSEHGAPAFPLELRDEERVTPPVGYGAVVMPWPALGTQPGLGRGLRQQGRAVVFANPLAVPGYGYRGLYASGQPAAILTWGLDDLRCLHQGGIWRLSGSGGQVFSTLGLPVWQQTSGLSLAASQLAGFAGRAIVAVAESGVMRHDPARGTLALWAAGLRQSSGIEEAPMPAVAVAGHTLLLAAGNLLRIQDVPSGTVLWEGAWPDEGRALVTAAREGLEAWQSMRWSSRGVFLNDGRGRTLTVDWKGLAAGGDWIVPVGTRTLVCLRGTSGRVESGDED